MTVPDELAKLSALLEALAVTAEMFATQADSYSEGVARGAFVQFSAALRSAHGYADSIQRLAEVTDHAT
jgi:hypothetical protein